MSEYVLDASAVLALLHREPGHLEVAKLLDKSAICLGEPLRVGVEAQRERAADGVHPD